MVVIALDINRDFELTKGLRNIGYTLCKISNRKTKNQNVIVNITFNINYCGWPRDSSLEAVTLRNVSYVPSTHTDAHYGLRGRVLFLVFFFLFCFFFFNYL